MLKIVREWRRIHAIVVGSESWYAAWQAIKAELGSYLPNLVGWGAGLTTLIGSLLQDIGWVGIAVLTFGAFVAARQFVLQGDWAPRPGQHPVAAAPVAAPVSTPAPKQQERRPEPETPEEQQAKHDLAMFV